MRKIAVALLVLLFACPPSALAAGGWRRAFVADERLSVLRERPALAARPSKRLRVGRAVSVVARGRDAEGRAWLRVAVTRRTRGWILASALAVPGDRDSEARVVERLAALRGLDRIALARLVLDDFPRFRETARAALRDEAAAAAGELSDRANRRLGALDGVAESDVRALMLSDPGLDRYARLGVRFDVDARARRFVPRVD